MSDLRSIYLREALGQMPRLLSLQDRNPYSSTYGSFHGCCSSSRASRTASVAGIRESAGSASLVGVKAVPSWSLGLERCCTREP